MVWEDMVGIEIPWILLYELYFYLCWMQPHRNESPRELIEYLLRWIFGHYDINWICQNGIVCITGLKYEGIIVAGEYKSTLFQLNRFLIFPRNYVGMGVCPIPNTEGTEIGTPLLKILYQVCPINKKWVPCIHSEQ